jgi:hypothetical protein
MPVDVTVLIFSLFFSQAGNKQAQQQPDQAFKHWMHSFEEDSGDLQVTGQLPTVFLRL